MLFTGIISKQLRKKRPQTLFNRLVRIISLLTFSIVILFASATLLITYSFETVLFNERLQQAHISLNNGEPLPYNFKYYNFSEQNVKQSDSLDDLNPDLKQRLLERVLQQDESHPDKRLNKIKLEDSEYHYLLTNDGVIVYDTSNVTIIDRALEDVFLILVVLLLPVAALTYGIAKLAARYALKPFAQLTQLFAQSQLQDSMKEDSLQDIAEQDVKNIALELQDAIQQKAQALQQKAFTLQQKTELLEQQVTFNKGMAHELRTPLQVMQHSIELLDECYPGLADSGSFQRLDNAVNRTIRLTNGLLWLTSEQVYNDDIDVGEAVQSSVSSLEDLCEAYNTVIQVKVKDNFRLAMPAVVLDLILFNLFNNVVTHASGERRVRIEWTICVDKNHINFSNAIEVNATADAEREPTSHNFGIGLDLVSRLAKRFDVKSTYFKQDDKFIVSLLIE